MKLKITVTYNSDYDECILILSGISEITATTEGSIINNEIHISKTIKNLECFVSPEKTEVGLAVNFLSHKQITNSENHYLILRKPSNFDQPSPAIVFTGKEKNKVFDERIKQKLTNWRSSIFLKNNELIIEFDPHKKPELVCLGILDKEIRSHDLCFVSDPDILFMKMPTEAMKQFENQMIALHLLVKPDFQKKIKNLYYKSRISNVLEIKETSLILQKITDFQDPINRTLNPLKWMINHKTQLPELVSWA